ncbi:MAG TPA: DUF4056 domain-containing protein [Prolixibacteraceae bacterium]|nr:DUF4056 domain-containing protein [Prolixibacteraceae bacterium]
MYAKAPVFEEKDYFNHPPRIIRTCCAFGSDLKVSIVPGYRYTMLTSAEKLGPHKYLGDKSENNGILYTRRGGFVDFGHLRDLVDWTAYLYNLGKKSQQTGEIFIDLGFESGEKSLVIKIPPGEKEEDLINLAGRIAYDLSIWHEITSWFGASAVPLVSERFSSFSLEDAFSNLLGTRIAAEAINSELPYEEAVTSIIRKTMIELEAVSTVEESYQAMEAVRDIWWTRKKHLPNNRVMLQREIGVYTTMAPWLVPGWESKNPTPFRITLPLTTRDGIRFSEFYTLTFDLNRKVPVRKIFPDRTDRMVTQNDFQVIIDYIGIRMLETNIYHKM